MNTIQIEACLEMILEAAGSSLRHYEPYTKDKLREAMRTVEGIALAANVIANAEKGKPEC